MTIEALTPGKELDQKRLRRFFWILAIGLAILESWVMRFYMSPDGLSYLDVGDAYFRIPLADAVNGYWSPLYSWVLGLAFRLVRPAPQYEAWVVHAQALEHRPCTVIDVDAQCQVGDDVQHRHGDP